MVEQNASFIEPSCHGASSSEKVIGNTKQSTDLNYFSDPNEVPYIPETNLAMERFIKETIVEALSGIFGTRQKELDNVQTAELNQINEAEILQKSPAELSQIEKKTIVNSSNSKNHQKTKVTIQNDLSFKVPVPNPRKNSEMLNEHKEKSNDLDLKRENNNSKQPNKFEVEESTYSDYCSDSNNVPFYSTTPSGTLQRETQNSFSNRGAHEVTYVNVIELEYKLNDRYYENFQVKNAAMLGAHSQKRPIPTPRKSFQNEKITKEQQENARKCKLEEPFYDEVLEWAEGNDIGKERNDSSCSSKFYETPYLEKISPRNSLFIKELIDKSLTIELSSLRKTMPLLQDTNESTEMKPRDINGISKCEYEGNINKTICCNDPQEKLAENNRLLLAENERLKRKIQHLTQEREIKPCFSFLPHKSEVSVISCETH